MINKKYIEGIYKKISKMNKADDVQNFIEGILTNAEIKDLYIRIDIARRLLEGESYTIIRGELHVGYDTVARVKRWLEAGDYEINRKKKKSQKIYEPQYADGTLLAILKKKYKGANILTDIS